MLPIFLPLLFSFAMVFGYGLLFFGQMFVASALGEPDHPRWPEWDRQEISEGLGRWIWAGVFGLVLGGFPVVVYWIYCGDIDWFDRVVFADLVILGAGYALMALAASLLHDSLVAANPITVLPAIVQVGLGLRQPCLVGGHLPDARRRRALVRALPDRLDEAGGRSPSGASGSSSCTRRWSCSGWSA